MTWVFGFFERKFSKPLEGSIFWMSETLSAPGLSFQKTEVEINRMTAKGLSTKHYRG